MRRPLLATVLVALLAAVASCSLPGTDGAGQDGSDRRGGSNAGASGGTSNSGDTSDTSDWSRRVAEENARPGVTDGTITARRGQAEGLDAFADRVSVLPGESFGLHISSRTPQVAVRALRVGHYGGAGMRQVWAGTVTAREQEQPAVITDPLTDLGGVADTRAVRAPWSKTADISTTGWPEGAYLLRLDAGEASRYALLTVRSADVTGRLVVLNAPLTWQAYNTWGGRSLYGDGGKIFSERSYAVSFDRPYGDGYGSGRFRSYDEPILREAERLGLPLAWLTDYDIAVDPGLLKGATGIVIGGHAEYWTGPARDAVTAAVQGGANLAVFGANTAYWRVRLGGKHGSGSPRIVFGPKSAALDPLAVKDPGGAAARFKDEPRARREEDLTGARYDCFPAAGDWVVSDESWFGYAGTGLRNGSRLQGVLGPESDRVYGTGPIHPLQVVAYSTFACGANKTAHTGVYWTNPSGAGVFNAATMGWPVQVTRGSDTKLLRRITDNVLTAFAAPRAGAAHPATDNVAQFWLPEASTTGAS